MLVAYCPNCRLFDDPLRLVPEGTEVTVFASQDPAIPGYASIFDGRTGDVLKNAHFNGRQESGCTRQAGCGTVLLFDVPLPAVDPTR